MLTPLSPDQIQAILAAAEAMIATDTLTGFPQGGIPEIIRDLCLLAQRLTIENRDLTDRLGICANEITRLDALLRKTLAEQNEAMKDRDRRIAFLQQRIDALSKEAK